MYMQDNILKEMGGKLTVVLGMKSGSACNLDISSAKMIP